MIPREELLALARDAAQRAYCPYSHFHADAPLNERTPCGACRQWLADLAPRAVIYIDGSSEDFTIRDLLPYAFGLPG